ncbi:MAG TPA: hypothetical protein VKH43_14050 [Thermoanaerobaculia bacterium]|nr:hypothetical protein [Thermoanaerobaculia bacterium]
MATKRSRGSGRKKARGPAPRQTKKAAARRTASRRKAAKAGKKRPAVSRSVRRRAFRSDAAAGWSLAGLGPDSGGQSGDIEGLSRAELADSESVEELVEEGQAFEAGIISGVENARDADRGGVRTRQVPEDDVPQEYLDDD